MLTLSLANRHGLVTGATGTGKTVTLQVWRKVFRAPGSRSLPPTSKATCPASRRPAKPRRRSLIAPKSSASPTSRTSFRSCSGICSASRATRSAPPSQKWGRCCWRGCSTSTRPRKGCSTSPSASPTSGAWRCWTSRTCAPCSASCRTTLPKYRRPTAMSREPRSAPSSDNFWCWKIRTDRNSSANRRSTSGISCAPTARGAGSSICSPPTS